MTDDLIARLSADLQPVAPRALERRLGLALLLGLAGTILIGPLVLDLIIGRPFGGAWGDPEPPLAGDAVSGHDLGADERDGR